MGKELRVLHPPDPPKKFLVIEAHNRLVVAPFWVPAFAGMTEFLEVYPTRRSRPAQ